MATSSRGYSPWVLGIDWDRSPTHRPPARQGLDWSMWDHADVRRPDSLACNPRQQRTSVMNQIVWVVGAVVILFVLGYFGLR